MLQRLHTQVELDVAKAYRHEVDDACEVTLCGITADEVSLEVSCGCGHPECEFKVTCPICLSLITGEAN